jgi:peptide/nickel transport system permease protein
MISEPGLLPESAASAGAPRRRRRASPGLLRGGIALVGLLVAVAAAAPLLAPHDPAEQVDPATAQNLPPGSSLAEIHLVDGRRLLAERVARTAAGLTALRRGRLEIFRAAEVANLTAGGVAHRRRFVLGSDRFGRDVLSRTLYGARVSLAVAILAVALALSLGIAVGAAAALGGRLLDGVLMRLVDALLAFPSFFLVIAISALFHAGGATVVLVLAATSWMETSRLARAELLSLERRDFVLAARATGEGPLAIFWRHLLPNAMTPLLVQGALLVGLLILAESSLSFLGLGIQPPTPSWGNMISDGSSALVRTWWVATFPGAALAVTVIAFNLLADGLRDALDPRSEAGRRRGI